MPTHLPAHEARGETRLHMQHLYLQHGCTCNTCFTATPSRLSSLAHFLHLCVCVCVCVCVRARVRVSQDLSGSLVDDFIFDEVFVSLARPPARALSLTVCLCVCV